MRRNSDDYEKEAIGWLNRGEADTALKVFRDGLVLFPEDRDLLLGVAMAHTSLGNYVPAVQVLEPLRAKYPTWGDVLQGLVDAYLAMGRKKQAVEAAMKAIAHHETDADFVHGIGVMLYERTLYRDAAKCYMRALELNHRLSPAYMGFAACSHKLGEIPAAISSLIEALRYSPDYWEAASYMGNLYYDTKKRAEAQQVWNTIPVDKLWDPVALKRLLALSVGPDWADKRKALRAQQKALEKARAARPRPEKAEAVMEKLDERMNQASLARHPRGEGGWGGMPTIVDGPASEVGFELSSLLSRMGANRIDLKKRTGPSIPRLDRMLAETFMIRLADFLDLFPWIMPHMAAGQGLNREPDKKPESLYDTPSTEKPVRLAREIAELPAEERRRRGLINIFEWADATRMMLYGKAVVIESRKHIGKKVFPHVAIVKLREAAERLKPNVPLKTADYEAWAELRAALEPQ